MKTIIKLPSGINPVVPSHEFQEEIDKLLASMFDGGLTTNDDGSCKHDLRTSFIERDVIVYCTKCTYRIKGAQAWKTK